MSNNESLGRLSAAEFALTTRTDFTSAQTSAALGGASIAHLARHHGLSYGDAAELKRQINQGARLADDYFGDVTGRRGVVASEDLASDSPSRNGDTR